MLQIESMEETAEKGCSNYDLKVLNTIDNEECVKMFGFNKDMVEEKLKDKVHVMTISLNKILGLFEWSTIREIQLELNAFGKEFSETGESFYG